MTSAPNRSGRAPSLFRALGHRDFRWLWLGQVVSLTGSWMQRVAQGWLVLRLTDSAFYLGLVGFCSQLPFLLFALAGGVAADRFARRSALVWTQGLAMVLATVLAVLTWSGQVQVWHIALLAFGLGTVTAFDIPIRHSFFQELVGRENLQNAIAMNSMAFNGARLVGPAIAGIIVARWGEAVCFSVNAVSFLAVLVGLALMRATGAPEHPPSRSWLSDVLEVVRYAWRTPVARSVLALIVVSSVFGMPYSILMPVFARDVLGLGSSELGFLMAAAGVGALFGGLYLAGSRFQRRAGTRIVVAMGLFGSSLLAFSLSRRYALSLGLLVLVGTAMLIQLATSNTFLQLLAPARLRGRIVSLYMLSFIGMAPFGSLLSGTLAKWAGAPFAVGLGGAICLVTAAVFAIRGIHREP